MSQIQRKWVADHAINNDKIDNSVSYVVAGLGIGTTPVDGVQIWSGSGVAALRLESGSGRPYQINSNTAGKFNLYDVNAAATRLTVTSAGLIGVGTTSPSAEFHVRTASGPARIMVDAAAGRGYQLISDAAGSFNLYDSNASLNRVVVTPDSGGTTLAACATATSAAMRIRLDDGANGRIYDMSSASDGAWYLRDFSAGQNRLKVGVNGLSVYQDTTVAGGLQVSGTVTINNTDVRISEQLEVNNNADTTTVAIRQTNGGAGSRVLVIENEGSGPAMTVTDTAGSIGSGGLIGVGTTQPITYLHVIGVCTDSTYQLALADALASTNRLDMGVTGGKGYIQARGIAGAGIPLNFCSGDGNVTVTIDNNGLIGVGSTTPRGSLDVWGNGQYQAYISNYGYTAGALKLGTNANVSYIQSIGPSASLRLNSDGSDVIIAGSGSRLGVGTTNPEALAHVKTSSSSPALLVRNSTAGHSLQVNAGTGGPTDTTQMVINSNGVGIGNTQPVAGAATSLTIEGNIFPSLSGASQLGSNTRRWATLYMASTLDYTSDLSFVFNGNTNMVLTTSGRIGMGTTPTNPLHMNFTLNTPIISATNHSTIAGAQAVYGKCDATAGSAVVGDSSAGDGVVGNTQNGIGVFGTATGTGTCFRARATGSSDIFQGYFAGSKNVVITQSGATGIGATDPITNYNTGNLLVLKSASGDTGMTIHAGATNVSSICFKNGVSAFAGQISYDNNSGKLLFGTNGISNQMVLSTLGRLGIGTGASTPLYLVHADGSVASAIIYSNNNSSAGAAYAVQGDAVGGGTGVGGNSSSGFGVYGLSTSGTAIRANTTSGMFFEGRRSSSTHFQVDSTGNTGFGTTANSVNGKVYVKADSGQVGIYSNSDTVGVSGESAIIGLFGKTSTGYGVFSQATGAGSLFVGGADLFTIKFQVDSTGNTGIGTTANPLNSQVFVKASTTDKIAIDATSVASGGTTAIKGSCSNYGTGVWGKTDTGWGIYGQARDTSGYAVYANADQATGWLFRGGPTSGSDTFGVDRAGNIFHAGTLHTSAPADMAEWSKVVGDPADYGVGTLVQQSGASLTVRVADEIEEVYGVVTDRATFCGGLTGVTDFNPLVTTEEEIEKAYNAKRIAMVGHVKMRVKDPVAVGARLVLSNMPGVACQAITKDEKSFSVAIARESFDGNGIGIIEVRLL